MIRVVVAVVLAAALLGASLPAAERAERDRNAAVASAELDSMAAAAERLATDNDPADRNPATTTVRLDVPAPTVTDGGRVVVAEDRLVWWPRHGPNRTVDPGVGLRIDEPIVLVDLAHLRLSLVYGKSEAVVRITRPGAQS